MWKVHVKRKELLLKLLFSWTPYWYSQAGRVLKKEGKQNKVISCKGLRKINSDPDPLLRQLNIFKQCGTLNELNNCRLSNKMGPLHISMVKSDVLKQISIQQKYTGHSTVLCLKFHRTFLRHQMLVLALEICAEWEITKDFMSDSAFPQNWKLNCSLTWYRRSLMTNSRTATLTDKFFCLEVKIRAQINK